MERERRIVGKISGPGVWATVGVWLLIGCGGGGGGGGSAGSPAPSDTVRPTIVSVSPGAGAAGVAIDARIEITFSESMDPATASEATVKVRAGAADVAGTISCADDTITFTPAAVWGFSTGYTVTISGGPSGVKDMAGNSLAADFAFAFSTGTAPDTTPPTVTGTKPADGATEVSVDAPITVSLSEPVTNVTTTTFRLMAGATPVPGTVADNGAVRVFVPSFPLSVGITYTATVTTGVMDLSGNHMASDYTWTFTTGADTTPPVVLSTSPVHGATGVPVDTIITAAFSESVGNVTAETFLLTADGVPVTGTVSISGLTARFTPSAPLLVFSDWLGGGTYGPTYRATVTTGVTDLSGNHLATEYSWTFTTGLYVDTTPPSVVSRTPADMAMGVSVGTFITATFDETVTNVTAETFLLSADGVPVPGTVTSSGPTAIFAPSAPLATGATYMATVTAEIRDLAGNHLAADQTWTFTTDQAPDTIPPTVASTNPREGAAGVAVDTAITATFGEPVTNVTDVTFLLTADGAPVPGTVVLNGPTAGFVPAAPLAVGPTYRATITTGVTDLSGNSLAANYVWSFTARTPGWEPGVPIDAGSADAFSPQVAVDGWLNAFAVWGQSDGTADSIWSKRYDIMLDTVGASAVIETGGGAASSPQVAISNGNAYAVWVQFDGTADSIWSNRSDLSLSAGWGTATSIETGDGKAWAPQVAADNSGNAVAVWVQQNGNADSIWANRYDPATGWGTPTPVETGNGDASSPQVGMGGSGEAVAVWVQPDGNDNSIWASRYTPAIGWETPNPIETATGRASSPQVAVDNAGNAIAVWVQSDGAVDSIWANRYVPGRGWGKAILVESGEGQASSPQVAMNGGDNAVAVWVQSDGAAVSIWANRYVPATGWGVASLIETGSGTAFSPQVAISNGNAIAVWVQFDGAADSIWENRCFPGTGWGTAMPVEARSGRASSPQVAITGTVAVVVWEEWDGTRRNILISQTPAPIPGPGCAIAGTRGGWRQGVAAYAPLVIVLVGMALRNLRRRLRMA